MSTANEQSASSTKRSSRPSYQQSVDEVLAALASDAQLGLSAAEARARLARYGKNELTAEKPVPAWRKFNQLVGNRGDVGIWHETYRVSPGAYENIYVNMPPFGLGKAGTLYPATGGKQSASARMGVKRDAL